MCNVAIDYRPKWSAFPRMRRKFNVSTYVLVHGAWHTGDELESVAESIREAGHVAHAPTVKGDRPGDVKNIGIGRGD